MILGAGIRDVTSAVLLTIDLVRIPGYEPALCKLHGQLADGLLDHVRAIIDHAEEKRHG
jgi:uncharacterized Fe-S cluster-containing radical SAM superfamily protein